MGALPVDVLHWDAFGKGRRGATKLSLSLAVALHPLHPQ